MIVSEPSNPWIAGIGNLFTRESFALARERLSERGVFCQWVHAGYASQDTFRLVARTFQSVFPDAALFEVFPDTDYLLVGARAPLLLDSKKIAPRFTPEVARDLATLELREPLDVLWSYCMGPAELRAFAGDGPLNTDDDALLEHLAPRAMDGAYDALHDPRFTSSRRPPPGVSEVFAEGQRTALLALRLAPLPGRAVNTLRTIAMTESLDPGRGAARRALRGACGEVIKLARQEGRAEDALRASVVLEAIARAGTDPARRGSPADELAIAEARAAVALEPNDLAHEVQLVRLLAHGRGDLAGARLELEVAKSLDPLAPGVVELEKELEHP